MPTAETTLLPANDVPSREGGSWK